ncbi:MAG: histidine phosphatase family protein [Clostridiales bacterium]|jgi:probable phosphoglycerate mutase|nr:histidine phosphatase family protein [Clostridiales bacterium]
MEIYLIRHGECYNSTIEYYDAEKKTMNPPLTYKGMMQAEKLAVRCKTIGFDMIISSDLLRAVQTAEKIKIVTSCEFSTTPAFREIDMGAIYVKSWDNYPDLYAQWVLHNQDLPYPDGENGEDIWSRCKTQLESLIATHNKKIAIVCHGGTIRSIICGVLGIPQQKRFYLGLLLENCSISIIRYSEKEKRFYLHTFNDFSHISG